MIRLANPTDASAICDIYNHYVTRTIVTFEETPVTADEMVSRITEVTQNLPWLVFLNHQDIVGFAYASSWKSRCAYRYSVESTVYLSPDFTGKGIGTLLYTDLIGRVTQLNYHTIIGGIALPNTQSVHLHEKLGFQQVAQFKEVGFKFNKWIDVGYWQLILENRAEKR